MYQKIRVNLRVIHLIDHLGIGGAQRFLCDLVLAQQKSTGIEPAVCCLTERTTLSAELEETGARTWHLEIGRWRPLQIVLLLPRLYQLLKRAQPDIIHTHLFVSGVAGRLVARLLGTPTVVHEQCNESTSAPWFAKKIDSLLAPWTSAVICVSESTAEFNLREKCVPLEKIHIIPNSINPERLESLSSARERVKLREDLHVPKDALVVTGIGRMVWQKRFDLFLQIAARVLKIRSDIFFLIVGGGPEREQLEADAKRSGIGGHVRFLGVRDDIGLILGITDIYLLVSDFEGFPLTLLEAMAMGVCVVATDVDGAHEMLAGNGAGVLVPPGNALAAAEALLVILGDREQRRKTAVLGRDIVLQHYAIEATAAKVEAIYRTIRK